MTRQTELFTPAIAHKEKALHALQRFVLPEAKSELEIAQEIDPYLADLTSLLQATEFMLEMDLGGRSKPAGLAKAWQKLNEARTVPSVAVFSLIETLICERLLQLLPPGTSDFSDGKENSPHTGYCCLVLNRFEEAHDKLLTYLTAHAEELHPRLWGYFGDASYKLRRHKDSNGGYLRALFLDPRAVDMVQMQHPELRHLLRELCNSHPDQTARALLPIHGWLEKILYIPKGNKWLAHAIGKQRFDHSDELLLYPDQRYHQFALCLYIDQAGLHGDIDFDARTEMQRLDGELFRQYLTQVGR